MLPAEVIASCYNFKAVTNCPFRHTYTVKWIQSNLYTISKRAIKYLIKYLTIDKNEADFKWQEILTPPGI